MCVWTKKRGSLNALALVATPCPKSMHGKGEKWITRNILGELSIEDLFRHSRHKSHSSRRGARGDKVKGDELEDEAEKEGTRL